MSGGLNEFFIIPYMFVPKKWALSHSKVDGKARIKTDEMNKKVQMAKNSLQLFEIEINRY